MLVTAVMGSNPVVLRLLTMVWCASQVCFLNWACSDLCTKLVLADQTVVVIDQ